MPRISVPLDWLSGRGVALAALEQSQQNGAAIATLTSAFIEWSSAMTDAADRLETQVSQDTADDQIALDTINELRAGQAALVQQAQDAIAQSGLDAQAKADAEANLQALSDRVDAAATKLAGSRPIPEDQIPPPTDTGGGSTDQPPPAPDQTSRAARGR